MRIGIDIKCLRTNNSGIGRYTRNLLDALQQVDAANEYILFSPSPVDYSITNPKWKFVIRPTKLPGILWQQWILPGELQREKVDVIWGPEQTLPVGNLQSTVSVLTVHDFVYRRFPETMRKSVLWITRSFGHWSIQKANAIVPVSEFTKGELFHFYPNIDKDKVEVVSCGVNVHEHNESTQARKEQLLFVGSLEPRKNLTTLIKALEILKEQDIAIPLVLTGPKGWKNKNFKDLISDSSVAENVCHKGFVSDEELRRLYSESAAVIFPSLYEGFGLPVLEALASRTPVLTSRGTVMESILGECGTYFDPSSPQSMAEAIKNFLNAHQGQDNSPAVMNPENFENRRQAILSQYTWENSARKLIKVFEKVCHG